MNTQTNPTLLRNLELDRRQRQIKEISDSISNLTNNMSAGTDNAQKLGDEMWCDHRTLIQSKMHLILGFIKRGAEIHDAGFFDARNEETAKLCKKMWEVVKDDCSIEGREDILLPQI